MALFWFVYFLLLGAGLGSFVHAMAFRFSRALTAGAQSALFHRRSCCPACGEILSWWENVPLVSWLLLRGRCRRCRAKIPVVYWLAEVGFGFTFALSSPSTLNEWLMLWPLFLFGFLVFAAHYVRNDDL